MAPPGPREPYAIGVSLRDGLLPLSCELRELPTDRREGQRCYEMIEILALHLFSLWPGHDLTNLIEAAVVQVSKPV